jgi:hypothetical protein
VQERRSLEKLGWAPIASFHGMSQSEKAEVLEKA